MIVTLDLHRVTLRTFENYKGAEKIRDMVRGIFSGQIFTPVFVSQIAEDEYLIDPNQPKKKRERSVVLCDGGHKRAVSHYIAERPLVCQLTPLVSIFKSAGDIRKRYSVLQKLVIEDNGRKYLLDDFARIVRAEEIIVSA